MKTAQTNPSSAEPRVELPAGELRQILIGLGKCMSRKPVHPELGCIRITSDGKGTATLMSTNRDTWNMVRLPNTASGAADAALLIAADTLRAALKGVPASTQVRIGRGDRGVILEVGDRKKELPLPKGERFPMPPPISGEAQPLTERMKTAIMESLSCASQEETRPILQGVAFDVSIRKSHHIIGTDGRHLYSANSFKLPVPQSVILPNNPLFQWKPFCEDQAWHLRISIHPKTSEGFCEMTSGQWRTVTRLIDGNYPNWRQVIPAASSFKHQIEMKAGSAQTISDRIESLSILKCGSHSPVVLSGEGGRLQIHWHDAESKKERHADIKECQVIGKPFGIALSQPLIAKALRYGLGHVEIIDEMSPARFSDGNGRQMIVMPLRHPIPVSTASKEAVETAPKPATSPPLQTRPTPPPLKTEPAPSLELAMQELLKVREMLQLATQCLRSTAGLIRQARQEQRSTDREVRSVRTTLQSLRKVQL